ncbi:hypothetical protein [Puia dinghuensis]|uniref:hypothetical protein n=1 Tax=Puia dinghuensis TaxID=1792502 RepID=UPI001668F7D2|nr:hypothetical protein [Puia dinghuensis]
MRRTRNIYWKALLMLVVFTANFTVFCHCATAAKVHCCCCDAKKSGKSKPCHSHQAVKFNLLEKQIADQVQAAPLPVIELLIQRPVLPLTELPAATTTSNPRHPPPDILALQQRFLI